MLNIRGPRTVSYNENKMYNEIILLPFCCSHVQGHLKPKLEKDKNNLPLQRAKFQIY